MAAIPRYLAILCAFGLSASILEGRLTRGNPRDGLGKDSIEEAAVVVVGTVRPSSRSDGLWEMDVATYLKGTGPASILLSNPDNTSLEKSPFYPACWTKPGIYALEMDKDRKDVFRGVLGGFWLSFDETKQLPSFDGRDLSGFVYTVALGNLPLADKIADLSIEQFPTDWIKNNNTSLPQSDEAWRIQQSIETLQRRNCLNDDALTRIGALYASGASSGAIYRMSALETLLKNGRIKVANPASFDGFHPAIVGSWAKGLDGSARTNVLLCDYVTRRVLSDEQISRVLESVREKRSPNFLELYLLCLKNENWETGYQAYRGIADMAVALNPKIPATFYYREHRDDFNQFALEYADSLKASQARTP